MKLPFVVDGDGSGPKLVFAHGLMGTGSVQRLQLAPLVEAGWTVATFDQRGHGSAPPVTDPSGYDPDAMGADLWEVADAAGFERCWVGGGSMGAATSFHAVKQQPDRVEGHIVAIPAFRDTSHPLAFVFDALADSVRDGGIEGLIALLRKLAVDMDRADQDEIFLEQLRSHDEASIECALRTVARWILPDVPQAFAGFGFPVVVIGWDADPIHPFGTAKDIAAAARAELLQLDQEVIFGDRELFGRRLLEVIPA
jgi:pimeloyl-ACP methyl ester carboxylesterase